MGYPVVSGTVTPSLGLSPLQLGAGTISPPTPTGSLQISANLDAGAAIGNTFSRRLRSSIRLAPATS
jgi:hypothetical protein